MGKKELTPFIALKRKSYTTRRAKIIDLLVGGLGWYIGNGILMLLFGTFAADVLTISAVYLLVNLHVVYFLFFTRYWMARGIFIAGSIATAAACAILMQPVH